MARLQELALALWLLGSLIALWPLSDSRWTQGVEQALLRVEAAQQLKAQALQAFDAEDRRLDPTGQPGPLLVGETLALLQRALAGLPPLHLSSSRMAIEQAMEAPIAGLEQVQRAVAELGALAELTDPELPGASSALEQRREALRALRAQVAAIDLIGLTELVQARLKLERSLRRWKSGALLLTLCGVGLALGWRRGRSGHVPLVPAWQEGVEPSPQRREEADAKLASLEELVDLLCDGPAAVAFVCQTDGTICHVSPQGPRLLGWSAGELQGQNLLEVLVPSAMRPTIEARLQTSEPGPDSSVSFDLVITGRERPAFPARLSFQPLHRCFDRPLVLWRVLDLRELQHFMALQQQVLTSTEQLQRNSLELRLSEARKAAILEAAVDCIISIDHEGTILEFNSTAERTFKILRAEATGMNLGNFALLPGLSEGFRVRIRPDVDTRELFPIGQRIEVTGLAADGTTFPAEFAMVSLEGTQPAMFTVFMRDITERRRSEQIKNELVSVVSHELRTPLTAIRGSLGLLEGGVMGALPASAQELITIARSNSDRLIRLINELLDLEKIEAGKLTLRLEDLQVEDLLEATLQGVLPIAIQAGVRLIRERNQVDELEGDRDRLVQVLTNLLSNAIKFSSEGQEVLLRASRKDERIEFEVIDHGPGIPAERMPRLFNRFEQGVSADGQKRRGTGLGLAISKAIVELHDGRIGVESEVGSGSRFFVELPLKQRRLAKV